ncbi:MAG TPA: carboxypeptidase regulatory-like domain-containing protein [Firmicutes bacterium]|nr:carboxypeptidase regulatory-like domain-containing protein [Bacillota bacterium]
MMTLKNGSVLLILFVSFSFLFIGCGEEGGEGLVSGTITAPDGETPVAGATVTITDEGGQLGVVLLERSTQSQSDGTYSFSDIPDGEYTVMADKGHFHGEITIEVTNGNVQGDTDVEVDIDPTKVAVVPGIFDDIGAILTDMGIGFTTIYDSDLVDWDIVNSFYVIFLNCGSDTSYAENEDVQENLRNFVKGGGSIYASDWEYLYIEYTWPDAIDFYGNDLSDPYIGSEQHVDADILDSELSDYMGKSVVEIYYNLGSWIVIDAVGEGTTTHIQGDIETDEGPMEDKPLLVSFADEDGSVVYTTFHNETQLTEDAENILKYFVFEL